MNGIRVKALQAIDDATLQGLIDVLIDCVEGGASVSFLAPMTRSKATQFWRDIDESLRRGERVLLAARDPAGRLVGTAQVIWATPENQPHRADVAKMLVHRSARNAGVGAALLAAAEQSAVAAGRTLLVLDTASAPAERLYQRGGWQRVGTIPRYALLPDGAFCDTVVFYKDLKSN